MTGLTEVKAALLAALGDDRVRDGDSERDLPSSDLSFHPPHRPDLVVYPGSTRYPLSDRVEAVPIATLATAHRSFDS